MTIEFKKISLKVWVSEGVTVTRDLAQDEPVTSDAEICSPPKKQSITLIIKLMRLPEEIIV